MIGQIKKIIREREGLFDKRISDIHISKFFHGRPEASKKIVFFVSAEDCPLCIVKIVREAKYNDLIEREVAGLVSNKGNASAPRLFFSGRLDGLLYLCEQVVPGAPGGKSSEVRLLSFVVERHMHTPKGKTLAIKDILALFSDFSFTESRDYEGINTLLQARGEESVFLAPQHGDCTYKNIIVAKGKQPVLIDWENFGLRNIWGDDVVHYLIRLVYGGAILQHDISKVLRYFVSRARSYGYDLGMSARELENVFLLDYLFDIFQKDYPQLHQELIPRMAQIWHL